MISPKHVHEQIETRQLKIGLFPYRIVKQLGADDGNTSDVYLATVGDPAAQGTTGHVVLKISKAQDEHKDFFEDAIFNEAERLRKLDHRSVVRILPIQTQNRMRAQAYSARASVLPGNPWFLVLEYLTGDSLASVLQDYQQLDVTLALEIVRKIAQTLEYLHYNDLVHLDIKPENILFRRPVEAGGRVEPVLIDFGIARNTGQAGLEGRTLHYAPPERILHNRGNAPPETLPRPAPSMDIYSLGVVFYQMLAGRRPFQGRTARSISSAILEGKPTRPSKYSNLVWEALDELVMQMLHRDPNQRPTAGELVQRLAELRTQPAQPAAPPTATGLRPIGAPRRRSLLARAGKVLAWLVALLLLAGGSIAAVNYARAGQFQLPSAATLQAVPVLINDYVQGLSGTPPLTPTPLSSDEVAAETATQAVTPAATLPVATVAPVATVVPTAPPAPPTARPATSTPLPTNTARPTPSPSFTPTPTRTRAPTSTPWPTNTVVPVVADSNEQSTTGQADTPPTRPPASVPRAVTLLEPTRSEGSGRETFSWRSTFALAPSQAYEPIFWRTGEDPLRDGKGWAGTTTETSISTDLLQQGAPPEAYYWGVLLVETEPYKRIQFLGESRPYILKAN